jgi:hypothetical protein
MTAGIRRRLTKGILSRSAAAGNHAFYRLRPPFQRGCIGAAAANTSGGSAQGQAQDFVLIFQDFFADFAIILHSIGVQLRHAFSL